MGVYRASAQILSGRKGKKSVGFADVVTEFNSSGTYNGALGIQEHTVLVVGGGGSGGKWGGGGGGGGGRVFGSFKMTRNECSR